MSRNGEEVILEGATHWLLLILFTVRDESGGCFDRVGVILIGSEGDVRQFRTACGSPAGNRGSPRSVVDAFGQGFCLVGGFLLR